jgi:hypothetical protein
VGLGGLDRLGLSQQGRQHEGGASCDADARGNRQHHPGGIVKSRLDTSIRDRTAVGIVLSRSSADFHYRPLRLCSHARSLLILGGFLDGVACRRPSCGGVRPGYRRRGGECARRARSGGSGSEPGRRRACAVIRGSRLTTQDTANAAALHVSQLLMTRLEECDSRAEPIVPRMLERRTRLKSVHVAFGRMSGSIWYASANLFIWLNRPTTASTSPRPSLSRPSFCAAAVWLLMQ